MQKMTQATIIYVQNGKSHESKHENINQSILNQYNTININIIYAIGHKFQSFEMYL